MSKPLTADAQLAAFKAAGLKLHEMAGWRTHNRNHKGAWGDVKGIVIHHTGSEISYASIESYMYNGDSARALPGPLSQFSVRRDGTVVLMGNGRCNHAGKGSRDVLAAVIAENYTKYPTRPGADNEDGNAVFYGFEVQYDGSHPMVKAQYDATVKAAAAICKAHGWSAKSIIGHKEWTNRKVDPGKTDMAEFRSDVQAILDGKPAPAPKPPTQIPTPPEENMPSAKEIADAILDADVIPHNVAGAEVNSNNPVDPANPTWRVRSVLEETENRLRVLEAKLDAIVEALSSVKK